jgi:ppGpp synthetase/RelA/SpoT-type nucleotidyltranferase
LSELEAIRRRYQADRPLYQELARSVADTLQRATRGERIDCSISHRAKEVPSLIKKALRKDYGWDDIRDKAGVRAITVYQDAIPEVEKVIRKHFKVEHYEDKRATLLQQDPPKLDYLGVHIEVSIPAKQLSDDGVKLKDLICEIQLHTQAQNLWATVSHELIYKSAEKPPAEVARSIYRLMALLELFDAEVERGRENIMAQPGYEVGRMVMRLEDCFYTLTARKSDTLLSREIVSILRPLYTKAELEGFDGYLATFVEENRAKLQMLFTDYLDDERNPIMSQPECLLVFDRLNKNEAELSSVWVQHLPAYLLRSLSEIWGKPVDVDAEG